MDPPGITFPLGNSLLIWTTLLLLYSSFFVAVRTWAKWQLSWSWADFIFAGGYLAALAQCTTVYLAVVRYGLGSELEDRVLVRHETWMQMLYISHLLYLLSMGLSRCSTAFFLRNLSRAKKHALAGNILAVIAVLWTFASIFAIALRGDLSAPWEDTKYTRWLTVEIIGLVIELTLWLFAFALIKNLNTQLHRRVKLLLIFGTRLALIPIILTRLTKLQPVPSNQTLNTVITLNILAQAAMHWSLISECTTCLKPFLQTWHEGAPAESEQSQYWGALSNLMSNSSAADKSGEHRLSRVRGRTTTTEGGKGQEGGFEDDGKLKLRLDLAGFSTRISSERKGGSAAAAAAWTSEAEDDVELLPASRIRVRMTTTMTTS